MRLAQIALAWVCTTALGLLVVPDVNMIPKGSIGSTARPVQASASTEQVVERGRSASSVAAVSSLSSEARAASATRSANSGWVMAATHWAFSAK